MGKFESAKPKRAMPVLTAKMSEKSFWDCALTDRCDAEENTEAYESPMKKQLLAFSIFEYILKHLAACNENPWQY